MGLSEYSFVSNLDTLFKSKNNDLAAFEKDARELARKAIKERRLYTVYRIAREFQHHNFDVSEMEQAIIDYRDPFYIYMFAKDIKNANVKNLQEAIIKSYDLDYVAQFACFIKGADVEAIENIIIERNNARAAYIIIKCSKNKLNLKLINILLKSKKPRYLYAAAQLCSDPQELELIESLIIKAHSNMYVRLFATNIPGANILKLEDRILKTRDMSEIRKFAESVGSERCKKLMLL